MTNNKQRLPIKMRLDPTGNKYELLFVNKFPEVLPPKVAVYTIQLMTVYRKTVSDETDLNMPLNAGDDHNYGILFTLRNNMYCTW